MIAKRISLTDEEIAAILTALRVRINDLHRLADNLNAIDDPADLPFTLSTPEKKPPLERTGGPFKIATLDCRGYRFRNRIVTSPPSE